MMRAVNTHLERKPFHPLARLTLLLATAAALLSGCGQSTDTSPQAVAASREAAKPGVKPSVVELSEKQLSAIMIETVGTATFTEEREAPGTVTLNDDASVQVYPHVQGRFLRAFVTLGDAVEKGQPLYSIESPDLAQAEASLISASGTLETATKTLSRAKSLSGVDGGLPQKEIEQATSDQHTAEGAVSAARDALAIFGKTSDEIDRIIEMRKVDSELVVRSPISGRVTDVNNAAPGVIVQAGSGVAPIAVANVTMKWLLAFVSESDAPLFQTGQKACVRMMALPNRVFEGRISKIYSAVDSDTRRVTVRTEIEDARNELRAGMLAEFVFSVGKPVDSTALPVNGVVRESDGTLTAWVTSDRKHFEQRALTAGLRRDGRVQILSGLKAGELAVTDGAVFLSNMLEAPPED